MPSSLSHLFLPVRSLDEARRLYVELLGLDVLVDEGGYVRIGGGGGFHMGVEQEPDGAVKQPDLVVRVDDVDATVARLRHELGREPREGEIAEAMNLTAEQFDRAVEELRALELATIRPLDAIGPDGESLLNVAVDPGEGPVAQFERRGDPLDPRCGARGGRSLAGGCFQQ